MAGEVVKVGPGVKTFKAGDKVVAMVNPRVSSLIYQLSFSFSLEILRI